MVDTNLAIQAIEQKKQQMKDWIPAKAIYTGLMAFNLLSFLWLLATGSGIEMPPIIWIARITTAPLAIYLGKLWKDRGFQILVIYTCLFFFRVLIPNPGGIFSAEMAESLLSALWLFAGCYGMGRILNRKRLQSLLFFCFAFWTLAMTIVGCISIYSVWTETRFEGFENGFIGLHGYSENGVFIGLSPRLNVIYSATISGSFFSISFLIALIIGLAARKKRIKAAFFVALAPILITLAFTDSRTAYVSVAAGIGVIIFSGIIGKTEKSEKFTRTNSWIKWLTAFGIMFLSFVIILYGMTLLTPALNQIKNQGVIPVAYAEGTGKANLSTRSFDDLSGRTDLWIEILNYIRSGWKIMLAGVSKVAPLQHFGAYYAHCHCLYIQVLLESGIPGLFLIIFFIIYTIIHSIRTIRLPDIPLWIRLLPALPISLWVGDLAECFTWLRSSQCMMIAVLFICAGIINAQQTNTKEQISKT